MILQQIELGDKHEEGYEDVYIKAYDKLTEVLSSIEKIPNEIEKGKKNELYAIRDTLETKLCQAYSNFVRKSKLFEQDDPEVCEEFKKRAANICKRFDINKCNEITNHAGTYKDANDSINLK